MRNQYRAQHGTYKVIVQFVVSKDGKISDIKAETNYGYGMEKEAIRLLKVSPNRIPATIDGKPEIAIRRQPVTFAVLE
ncbi:MAG TPA: energy transducer TonB [Ferruginibacter sp.]|nr:energy transducer TonB [Bacteroidota bacterium]MBS1926883.1 energy transducer TonB [Bacteroidota bacterium]MCC6692923.1 energy transducer TonB [Chitinophagaceae bacterium]HMT97196.1 energy transducer TonB [Ferruginibacter sp.]HMU24467.1 energy transducer TonB [Ferruginibacter sp.]